MLLIPYIDDSTRKEYTKTTSDQVDKLEDFFVNHDLKERVIMTIAHARDESGAVHHDVEFTITCRHKTETGDVILGGDIFTVNISEFMRLARRELDK
jgi:hypothetical protein